jgi:hypothetical protein
MVAFVSIFTLGALLIVASSAPSTLLWAQSTTPLAPGGVKNFTQINPPPCDFNDNFYTENGIVVGPGTGINAPVAGRFGTFREFGPPATSPTQANWVVDSTCSVNDPTRRNFRILATTGGYPDDNSGSPTEFISILAFLTRQTDDFTGVANKRNIQMVDIVSNFEAYAALKQILSNGQFAGTPCGTMGDPTITPCFPVTNPDGTSAVATPGLRQDWRFATNRNAIDGSDNNIVNGSGANATIVQNSPFGYFCDDLLGMWIITYFWFTPNSQPPFQPGNDCQTLMNALQQKEGTNLDGTPIVRTANELTFMEGVPGFSSPFPGIPDSDLPTNFPCMAENKEDPGGADSPAAVWLICPGLLDPRNGAIATDAFLDVVRLQNGNALDTGLLNNFSCLQNVGKFCNEASPEQ